MSITDDALRISEELRAAVHLLVDAEERRLVIAWARAWDEVVAEWESATYALAVDADGPPTVSQVRRAERAQRALAVTADRIDQLLASSMTSLTTTAAELAAATADLEASTIAAQMPAAAGDLASLTVQFDRVNPEALDRIVARTTKQITKLTRPLSGEATAAMKRALLQGVTQGLSPREVAARMVRNAERGFNGGLSRALKVARTELLDAYRGAAMAQQRANRDVLAGWVWHAKLDTRTCPSCVAMHGTLFELDDPGPWDHPNGRCARMPKTKSWRDLGFDMREPRDRIRSGEEWFSGLNAADQLAIMGPARLEALHGGLPFSALSTKRSAKGWRDSYVATPIDQLVA